METLIANLTAKSRKGKLHDRDHLVVPVTLIVPGVLNGSNGPLVYPADEVAKSVYRWNGMPLVVNHPSANGSPISAREIDVLNRQGVGTVLNARIADDGSGKLLADAWIDIKAMQRINSDLLHRVQRGEKIEVSTGLLTDNETVSGAVVARNYQPDHLAILTDQAGACSIRDGCGLNTNRKEVNMSLTKHQREEIVDDLVANSCCWEKEDVETLNTLSDDKLVKLRDHTKKDEQLRLVANAAQKEFVDEVGSKHTYDVEKQVWNTVLKTPEKKKDPPAKKEPVVNEEPKKLTEEEWLASAPVSVREDLAFARNEKHNQKIAVVQKLVANVRDEQQQAKLTDTFMKKSLEDLNDMLSIMPEAKPVANYSGAATPASVVANAEKHFAPFGLPNEYLSETK